jgi:hypothetical protein
MFLFTQDSLPAAAAAAPPLAGGGDSTTVHNPLVELESVAFARVTKTCLNKCTELYHPQCADSGAAPATSLNDSADGPAHAIPQKSDRR